MLLLTSEQKKKPKYRLSSFLIHIPLEKQNSTSSEFEQFRILKTSLMHCTERENNVKMLNKFMFDIISKKTVSEARSFCDNFSRQAQPK